jgi:hypothetical protein
MTAQHDDAQTEVTSILDSGNSETTDPIGPITLPKRTKVGARALALAGSIGMGAFAIAAVSNDVASTWPTISFY